jgi:hypothetical protein
MEKPGYPASVSGMNYRYLGSPIPIPEILLILSNTSLSRLFACFAGYRLDEAITEAGISRKRTLGCCSCM